MLQKGLQRFHLRFGLESPPSTGMREALQWLMLARLGVLYAVLTVIVLQQVFRREALGPSALVLGYGLCALSFTFNLFQSVFVDRLPQHWWVAATHVLFDAIITSTWIFYSGARDSLFALFYLIQILVVSLILYQKGAWLSAFASCVTFGVVTLLTPQPNAFFSWFTYSAMFLTLGIVGGYLSEELLRTNRSLQEKSHSMEKLMALHERILFGIPTGLLTVDNEMRVAFLNPAAEHILSRQGADLVGKNLSEVEPGLLPFFSAVEAPPLGEEARLPQRVEIGQGTRARILRGDVARLEADAGLSRLLDPEAKEGRVLLFQDVTKIVHLEEKLKQNEKLAAVGQLAAGIAHEIRNPLASMSASIEMLKGSLVPDSGYQENQRLMDIAIREIDRLNRLISEFLDFVKPEKFRFEAVDLPALIAELTLTLRESKDFKGQLTLREAYRPASALANGEKLKQVILNLLVNAAQAMRGKKGGTIEVGTSSEPESRVKLWVQDEGHGMSEEVLAHLYEPFFTTKEKGTGLGLATAYKIVEAHHGEIRVTSKVGVGTRFEVVLQSA